jgi:hypothetical protein
LPNMLQIGRWNHHDSLKGAFIRVLAATVVDTGDVPEDCGAKLPSRTYRIVQRASEPACTTS